MLSNVAGWLTKREGHKFLKLNQTIADSVFAGAREIRDISLYIHIPFCRTLCPFLESQSGVQERREQPREGLCR